MKKIEPTENALAFMKANDASDVVEGSAKGPGRGGYYRLADGRVFELTVADCRSIPDGYPRWLFEDRKTELRKTIRREKGIVQRRDRRISELRMERDNAAWKLRQAELELEKLK